MYLVVWFSLVPCLTLVADAGSPTDTDQVALALLRISNHIQNRNKFVKASQLLRHLLTTSPSQPQHAPLIFDTLCASMKDLSSSHDPELSMEYSRLFTLASKQKDFLSALSETQRAQLDIYGIHAVLRTKVITTDDSFALSRVVKEIKDMIEELPAILTDSPEEKEEEKALLAEDTHTTTLWADTAYCNAQRRAALVECLLAGKDIYHKPWSKTTIDMLVEYAQCQSTLNKESKFLPSQRKKIEGMVIFIKEQKKARSSGGSSGGGGGGKDLTSFEIASAEWSKAAVSARGKVGSGDGGTMTWLG